MCGILGTTKGETEVFQTALQSLVHRGPDATSQQVEDTVQFGHCRLSIIDPDSRGTQPMTSHDGRYVICFNGEIYNYQSLRAELVQTGVSFRTETDTEVLLEGFAIHGPSYFERLRGMWAVALYDRETGQLTLCRDQFGIKPLFYSLADGACSFASEIKALRGLVSDRTLNTNWYPFYFSFGYFPAAETHLAAIKHLLPGEILTYDTRSQTVASTQLTPLPETFEPVERISNYDDAVVATKKVLADSVDAHFVSDVPVALLFSGGTDSSLLAAIAKEQGRDPIAFHLTIEGNKDNEYATEIAMALGLQVAPLQMTKNHVESAYTEMCSHLDIPTANPSYIPTSIIYQQIKEQSRVVLSGEGGDELFGGYARHAALRSQTRLCAQTPFLLQALQAGYGQSQWSIRYGNPIVRRLIERYQTMLGDDVLGTYATQTRNLDYPLAARENRERLYELLKDSPAPTGLAPDRFSYLPHDLLLKNDYASMAASVEARVPLVDKAVWQFVLGRLDPSLCLSDKVAPKQLLQSVLEEYLPTQLVRRPKGGFSFSFSRYKIDSYGHDVQKAMQFHRESSDLFGLTAYDAWLDESRADLLIKKYPRFAFSLVVNHKVLQQWV